MATNVDWLRLLNTLSETATQAAKSVPRTLASPSLTRDSAQRLWNGLDRLYNAATKLRTRMQNDLTVPAGTIEAVTSLEDLIFDHYVAVGIRLEELDSQAN